MIKTIPFIIGLTGSIGMGKTTTAQMFADAGIPVWDADAAVHRLYLKGGAAVGPVGAVFSDAITNGRVDRSALKDAIVNDAKALKKLESIVHPLVAKDRGNFLAQTKADIVVLDIPLLFETGLEKGCDLTVVVSTSAAEQRARVMARKDTTEEQFELMLAEQMPDVEKRTRADVQIATFDLESTRNAVNMLILQIRAEINNA